MTPDYLIDTNILILLFNNQLTEPIPNGELAYSIITAIELLSFANLAEDDEALIRTSLKPLHQIPLTNSVVDKTIQLRRRYRLKTPDAIIIASAWDCGATLLSNDKQLSQVDEIQIRPLTTR